MPDHPVVEITELLHRAREGDGAAGEAFWQRVHAQLRGLAEKALAHERADHILQPTALVHEAYLRLLGPEPLQWQSRAHFFGAAATAMRRILVDHARARGRQRHGGGRCESLTGLDLAIGGLGPDLDLLALDEALARLQQINARMVQVIELRFFAGLGVVEIASMLGVAVGTVSGDWKIARLWLHRELSGERRGHGS